MSTKAWKFAKTGTQYDLCLSDCHRIDTPAPGSVRIRVHAVSLNYRDLVAWKNLAGRQVDQRVPCSDGAGEIVALGAGVTDWKVGDRVAGCFFQTWQSGRFDLIHHKNDLGGTLDGMLQQTVDLSATGIVRIPDFLTFQEASTLPCAALTAWYALVVRGGLTKDQTVLCLGTGGVSLFGMQIALAMGAKPIVLSSSHDKLAEAKKRGAWQTLNYKDSPQWADPVWEMTDKRGVDHVVEVGGPGTLEQSMKAVAAGGHIALIGVLTGFGAPNTSLFPLLARNVTVNGIYVGPRDEFNAMNAFFAKHGIRPIIDRVFPFESAPEAFAYLHSGKHFGKVVVDLTLG
jgi:NADPH:quinone reductase-like Zn-dependent oxidoreductase